MRFDDAQHLDSYQRAGLFPSIHAAMASFVAARAQGKRVLDLCCNAGLLGEQLKRRMPGSYVIGVDGDRRATNRARASGISIAVHSLRVDPSTYDELEALMRRHEIDVVVARRCLPEMLGEVMWSVESFAAALYAGGAEELFLQGRVPTPKPINPLHTVTQEIAAVQSKYTVRDRVGSMAYLIANGVEVPVSPGLSVSDGANPAAG